MFNVAAKAKSEATPGCYCILAKKVSVPLEIFPLTKEIAANIKTAFCGKRWNWAFLTTCLPGHKSI